MATFNNNLIIYIPNTWYSSEKIKDNINHGLML